MFRVNETTIFLKARESDVLKTPVGGGDMGVARTLSWGLRNFM